MFLILGELPVLPEASTVIEKSPNKRPLDTEKTEPKFKKSSLLKKKLDGSPKKQTESVIKKINGVSSVKNVFNNTEKTIQIAHNLFQNTQRGTGIPLSLDQVVYKDEVILGKKSDDGKKEPLQETKEEIKPSII